MSKKYFYFNSLGTYSLADPMTKGPGYYSCKPCPENGLCLGGDKISPLKGFWRASNLSTLILACPVMEACLGTSLDINNSTSASLVSGECLAGQQGALCYECTKGLARFRPKSLCEPCDSQPLIYLKLIISALFIIGYVIFQSTIFSRIERTEPNVAIFIKLLLNHIQTVGMIGLIDFGWTLDFDIYFKFQDYISFITEDFLSIDCFVQNIDENLFVIKIIFTTLLPIILSVIIFFIWLGLFYFIFLIQRRDQSSTRMKIKSKIGDYLIEKMRISTLVIVYILYPEILRKSFSLMNCIQLDNESGLKTLSFSPNLECWSKQHTFWVLAVALPGIIIWGILIPFFILVGLLYYKKYIIQMLSSNNNNDKKISDKNMIKESEEKESKLQTLTLENEPEILMTKLSESNSASNNKETNIKSDAPENTSNSDEKKNINYTEKAEKENKIHKENIIDLDHNEKTNISVKILMNFGYFYRGYNEDRFYWEIIMFSRKFLLVFIGVFTEVFPQNSKSTVFLVVINLYMYIQVINKPFKHDYLNRLENTSLFVCTLTGVIGILLYSENIKRASYFCLILVSILNLGFFCFWLHQIAIHSFGMTKFKTYWNKILLHTRKCCRKRPEYKII
jgi:hypothetical protein